MTKTKVIDWMTRNPITIEENASIMEALHVMKANEIRRLPVMRNGRLTGVITDRMLKDYSPGKATPLDTWEVHYLLDRTPVSEVMNKHPHTVKPDALLTDAALIIREHKLYGVCVLDDAGALVGVLTIKDLLDALFYLSELTAKAPELAAVT